MNPVSEPYKICMIDDIPTVVRGLTQRFDWEQYGLVVAGTATNGEEGMAMLREVKPDIVLTDIRMPFVDGIEMMKTIRKEMPWIKLIFLSGYTDFAYAQDAVRLGAFDYIVKPFTKEQVLEAVLKAKAALEREHSQARQIEDMEQKLRESMPYLRQEYMRLLIRYGSPQNRLRQQWDFFNIHMEESRFVVLVAEIDFFQERTMELPVNEVELIRFAVHNILEETMMSHTKGNVFRENVNQFVAVMNPPESLDIEQLAEMCRENVSRYTYQTVSIGVGETVLEPMRLSESYGQAMTALAHTFYTGGNSVYRYADDEHRSSALPRYSYEKEKELLYCLRSANSSKSEEQLEAIWEEWMKPALRPEPELVRTLCLELAHSMHRVFMEKMAEPEVEELEKKLADINRKHASFEEIRRQMKEYCRLGCAYLQKRQYSEARSLVEQAIEYIGQNLQQELSVSDCAKSVHLSPSYFSNLFKKEVGMTLAQYIISKRMEKAKEMLLEGMQVQDIAVSLGYEDRPYFSELFKRHTGMTPTEFRTRYAAPPMQGEK
jgi:two-component system, response regulator YesN